MFEITRYQFKYFKMEILILIFQWFVKKSELYYNYRIYNQINERIIMSCWKCNQTSLHYPILHHPQNSSTLHPSLASIKSCKQHTKFIKVTQHRPVRSVCSPCSYCYSSSARSISFRCSKLLFPLTTLLGHSYNLFS